MFEGIVTPQNYFHALTEVNISDASVDALYFGSAILIDIIVNFHFITRAETYELRENIITVRT